MSLVDSPFADKLNTNYAPSDSEVEQLRALLQEPLAELARLDAKRASLQAGIEAHRALLSPIRRIPEDIVREIFISCLPEDHDAFMDVTEAPMLLGRICGLWRRVAHSTPRLWTSVYIPPLPENFDAFYPEAIERILATLLKAWLERSMDCPLSLSLALPSFSGSQEYPKVVLDQLLAVSTRIRRLRFKGPIKDLWPVLELGAQALPMLESVTVDFTEYSPLAPEQSALFHVPTLRRFSLRAADAEALALPLAWEHLTELNLTRNGVPRSQGGFSAVAAFEVLRRCSSLIRCWLHVTVDLPLDQQPIRLPRIQMLSITIDFETAAGSAPEFLGHLTMPCLHYLQIGQDDDSPRFIDSSYSNTEGLTVYITGSTPIYPEMVIRIAQFLPITHLRLCEPPEEMYYYGLYDDLLENSLTATGCPSLRHLEMSKSYCTFSDYAVLAFILGRMETEHPLEQIDLEFDRTMETDIVEEPELELYIAQGLRVNLRYESPVPWTFRGDAAFDAKLPRLDNDSHAHTPTYPLFNTVLPHRGPLQCELEAEIRRGFIPRSLRSAGGRGRFHLALPSIYGVSWNDLEHAKLDTSASNTSGWSPRPTIVDGFGELNNVTHAGKKFVVFALCAMMSEDKPEACMLKDYLMIITLLAAHRKFDKQRFEHFEVKDFRVCYPDKTFIFDESACDRLVHPIPKCLYDKPSGYKNAHDFVMDVLLSLTHLSTTIQKSETLVLVVIGHGESRMDSGADTFQLMVLMDGTTSTAAAYIDKKNLERAVRGCRGKVVVFANSCYSGLLESPSWQLYCAGTATETPSALDLERYHAAVSIRERPAPTPDYVAKTLRRLIPLYLAMTTEGMLLRLSGGILLHRYYANPESLSYNTARSFAIFLGGRHVHAVVVQYIADNLGWTAPGAPVLDFLPHFVPETLWLGRDALAAWKDKHWEYMHELLHQIVDTFM
ncbi:hypothetical protein FB45DRAFT_861347 [Roridomyces roridus]|uniref:F-box domain-containing protein n=1 Tax=Roridomyces roridus TaxID=1738132 RepID=A0AAD7CAK1_9AGAR|nr:hypothetical protein FB45DRAFT_861347 [Roridomyces roridus]